MIQRSYQNQISISMILKVLKKAICKLYRNEWGIYQIANTHYNS